MITQCAKCGVEFLHASHGRIFNRRPVNTYPGASESKAAAEFYWLCDQCCTQFTLKFSEDGFHIAALEPPAGMPVASGNVVEQDSEAQHECPNCSVLASGD